MYVVCCWLSAAEDAAAEVVLQLALDEARKPKSVGGLGAGLGQHRWQVTLDDPVERRRLSTPVCDGRSRPAAGTRRPGRPRTPPAPDPELPPPVGRSTPRTSSASRRIGHLCADLSDGRTQVRPPGRRVRRPDSLQVACDAQQDAEHRHQSPPGVPLVEDLAARRVPDHHGRLGPAQARIGEDLVQVCSQLGRRIDRSGARRGGLQRPVSSCRAAGPRPLGVALRASTGPERDRRLTPRSARMALARPARECSTPSRPRLPRPARARRPA